MKFWNKLSPRERAMASVIGVLFALSIVYFIGTPALARIRELDDQIDVLEQDMINYERHLARQADVDIEFDKIAAQHSSHWTQVEIHDRLRSEIYRLAEANPVPLGAPLTGNRMIAIPQLPAGELESAGLGYREYKLEFKTAQAKVSDLMTFVRRLEESPQALRVEQLSLQRPPELQGLASAVIRVNRTVVDGVEEVDESAASAGSVDLAENGDFEDFSEGVGFPHWTAVQVQLDVDRAHTTSGLQGLRAEAQGEGAALYQVHDLVAGTSYSVSLDLFAESEVSVGVWDESTQALYDGAIVMDGSKGASGRCLFDFTVEGETGVTRSVRVPYVSVPQVGETVFMDKVSILEKRG